MTTLATSSPVEITTKAEFFYKENIKKIADLNLILNSLCEKYEVLSKENAPDKPCTCPSRRKEVLEKSDKLQDLIESNQEKIAEKKETVNSLTEKMKRLKFLRENKQAQVNHSIENIPTPKEDYASKLTEINERLEAIKKETSSKLEEILHQHQENNSSLQKKITDLKNEKIFIEEERDEMYCEYQAVKINQPASGGESLESESIYSQINSQRVEIEKAIVEKEEEIKVIRDRIRETKERFKTQCLLLTYLQECNQNQENFQTKQSILVESMYKKFYNDLSTIFPVVMKKLELCKLQKSESKFDLDMSTKILNALKASISKSLDSLSNQGNEERKMITGNIKKNELLLSLEPIIKSVSKDENKENSQTQSINSDVAAKNRMILNQKMKLSRK